MRLVVSPWSTTWWRAPYPRRCARAVAEPRAILDRREFDKTSVGVWAIARRHSSSAARTPCSTVAARPHTNPGKHVTCQLITSSILCNTFRAPNHDLGWLVRRSSASHLPGTDDRRSEGEGGRRVCSRRFRDDQTRLVEELCG